MFEIIQIMRRARGPISADAMADALEVSKRTVYRDVAALVAQRVPIRGEAGVGYVLEPGFDMPPLMLTADEIEAAVLGAQWVCTRGEATLARAAETLLAKIEAIAPADLRPLILEPSTSVAPIPTHGEVLSASDIRAAIRRRQKIRVAYHDTHGTRTERILWPIVVGYRDAGRILAAWCELRQDFRYFRTDRILAADVLAEKIPERSDRLRARWRTAMEAERRRYTLDK